MSHVLYFRCDAGQEHGLGHLARCRALAAEANRQGMQPRIICHAPVGMTAQMLDGWNIAHEAASGPIGSRDDQNGLEERLATHADKAFLVLDARELPPPYTESLNQKSTLACLDDEQYRDIPCRFVINPNPWATASRYRRQQARSILAGPAYTLVSPKFRDHRRQDARLRGLPTLLVTMGGEDPDNAAGRVLQVLEELPGRVAVKIVVGPAFRCLPELSAGVDASRHPVAILRNINDLSTILEDVDIAIVSASTSSYELATAGLPMVLVTLAEHQADTTRFFSATQAALTLPDPGWLESASLLAAVRSLLDDESLRKALRGRAEALFDGRGAVNVLSRIVERQ